jgi:hypothetical protein
MLINNKLKEQRLMKYYVSVCVWRPILEGGGEGHFAQALAGPQIYFYLILRIK